MPGLSSGLSALPVEVLREVVAHLEWRQLFRIAHLSGDRLLWRKLTSFGGVHDVHISNHRGLAVSPTRYGFSTLLSLYVRLDNDGKLNDTTDWLLALPMTLQYLRFDFALADVIWLRRLRTSDCHIPQSFLYECKGFVPISIRELLPNLRALDLNGSNVSGIDVLATEDTARLPIGLGGRTIHVIWNKFMICRFLQELPESLQTLRTGFLLDLGVARLPLPTSLTSLHRTSSSSEIPDLSIIDQELTTNLISLTWPIRSDQLSLLAQKIGTIQHVSVPSPHGSPRYTLRAMSTPRVPIKGPKVSATVFPPHLRSLNLHFGLSHATLTFDFFHSLPETLEHLELHKGDCVLQSDLVASLPRLLHTLIMKDEIRFSSIRGLPPQLTHLSLRLANRMGDKLELRHLPRSLTHLDIYTTVPWTAEETESLPPGLVWLSISFGSADISSEVIKLLPRSLQCLQSNCPTWSSHILPYLPPNLTSLVMPHSKLEDTSLLGLPKRLTNLELDHLLVTGSALPESTATLNSEILLTHMAALLPKALAARQPLRWNSSQWGWRIPRSIDVSIHQHLHLPPHLTSLDLTEIPLGASREAHLLLDLPESLTRLGSNVKLPRPLLKRLRHIYVQHATSAKYFFADYAPQLELTSICFPAIPWPSNVLLPAALEHFEIERVECTLLTPLQRLHTLIHATTNLIEPFSLYQLPKSITHLSICLGTYSSSGSHKYPLPSLRTLILPRTKVYDHIFTHLPPTVTLLRFDVLIIVNVQALLACFKEIGCTTLDLNNLSGAPPPAFVHPCRALVECGNWKVEFGNRDVSFLPQELLTFTMPLLQNCYRDSLQHLPPQLTCLDLRSLRHGISHDSPRYLPRTITSLWLDGSRLTTDSVRDFPRGLTQLTFSAFKAFRPQHARALPDTLQSLHVECRRVYDFTIPHLPRNLTTLSLIESCAITLKGISALPRSLKSLILHHVPQNHSWKEIKDALPPSLTQLYPGLEWLSAEVVKDILAQHHQQ